MGQVVKLNIPTGIILYNLEQTGSCIGKRRHRKMSSLIWNRAKTQMLAGFRFKISNEI